MLRVGLTGGIGAGKSRWRAGCASSAPWSSTPTRWPGEVVEPGSEGLAAVVAAFGAGVLDRGRRPRPARARPPGVRRRSRPRPRSTAILHPRIAAPHRPRGRGRARRRGRRPRRAAAGRERPGPELPAGLVVDAPAAERVRRLVADRGHGSRTTPGRGSPRRPATTPAGPRRTCCSTTAGRGAGCSRRSTALWRERLVPFEANLRAGRPAPRPRQAVLVDPDPTWAAQAGRVIARVRRVAGPRALRRRPHRVDVGARAGRQGRARRAGRGPRPRRGQAGRGRPGRGAGSVRRRGRLVGLRGGRRATAQGDGAERRPRSRGELSRAAATASPGWREVADVPGPAARPTTPLRGGVRRAQAPAGRGAARLESTRTRRPRRRSCAGSLAGDGEE